LDSVEVIIPTPAIMADSLSHFLKIISYHISKATFNKYSAPAIMGAAKKNLI
jgi:hypothetical protein